MKISPDSGELKIPDVVEIMKKHGLNVINIHDVNEDRRINIVIPEGHQLNLIPDIPEVHFIMHHDIAEGGHHLRLSMESVRLTNMSVKLKPEQVKLIPHEIMLPNISESESFKEIIRKSIWHNPVKDMEAKKLLSKKNTKKYANKNK